jgi:hypothetical protein
LGPLALQGAPLQALPLPGAAAPLLPGAAAAVPQLQFVPLEAAAPVMYKLNLRPLLTINNFSVLNFFNF